jgi:hypothetical protein
MRALRTVTAYAHAAALVGMDRASQFGLWVGPAVQGLGPKTAQHCAAMIFHFLFSFTILEIYINF